MESVFSEICSLLSLLFVVLGKISLVSLVLVVFPSNSMTSHVKDASRSAMKPVRGRVGWV